MIEHKKYFLAVGQWINYFIFMSTNICHNNRNIVLNKMQQIYACIMVSFWCQQLFLSFSRDEAKFKILKLIIFVNLILKIFERNKILLPS